MLKKQNGMTLVEVLATLLLSSLVIILIWTTVAISMKYNIFEANKLQMQQEVNYIVTDIQNIHRQSKYECYQIKEENRTWKIVECNSQNPISTHYNTKFIYNISAPSEEIYTKYERAREEGGTYYSSYPLTVEISNPDDKRPSIKVETTITRFDEIR